MLKKRNGLAVLLAMMLALCGLIPCAQADDLNAITPLVDLTAAAAMRVGETPETITEDGTLSEAFVYNFFLLGQNMDVPLGIGSNLLSDTDAQEAYLKESFVCGIPALSGIIVTDESYDYIGVQVMSAEMASDGQSVSIIGNLYEASDRLSQLTEEEYAKVRWLDKRAVITFVKNDNAPLGWKVNTFSVNAELDMEASTQTYFNETMSEYVNTNLGFSIQYPAVFTEDTLTETADGISGQLADGTASFFAKKSSNTSSWTLDKLISAWQEHDASAETSINEAGGIGRVTIQQDGMTVVNIYVVTEQWVYQAQLSYASSLAAEFSIYGDYMMNSFSADELGIG